MGRLTDAARGYLGVKWRHRGRSKHGLDCAGLGLLAYRDCGVELPDFTLYGREPHNDGLVRHLTAALGEPVRLGPGSDGIRDGDILVMRFVKEPHHVAIAADGCYGGILAINIIHADGHTGRVVEVRLDESMAARITHVFRRAV